jgi:hypothetical protein
MKLKPKITTKQLLAATTLLKNLKDFVDKKYGAIYNLVIVQNQGLPNTIVVKYEKESALAGERDYEFRIATIDQEGQIGFIDNKFKDVFERASFLSECLPLNIDDEKQYDKID